MRAQHKMRVAVGMSVSPKGDAIRWFSHLIFFVELSSCLLYLYLYSYVIIASGRHAERLPYLQIAFIEVSYQSNRKRVLLFPLFSNVRFRSDLISH